MKTSFQKTLIAASVGVAMFAAVSTASANSLLFPYFTTAAGAQSVVSISSNPNAGTGGVAAAGAAVAGVEKLHYVYNYGDTCTHYDGYGKVTANDLMQHSVASSAAGGFGKAVGTDGSTPFYFPLNATGQNFGFLVVTSANTPGVEVISGDMAIVDPATGLVVSYAATSNAAATEGDFSLIKDTKFNLSFYPTSIVDTSWYGVVAGDMSAAILAGANWTGASTLTNNGTVYDNDENPFSGTMTKKLTCAGKVAPSDLMNSAQALAVGTNGGLIHATASTVTAVAAAPNAVPPVAAVAGVTGIVLNKMQVVKAAVGAPFAGKMFLHREAAF